MQERFKTAIAVGVLVALAAISFLAWQTALFVREARHLVAESSVDEQRAMAHLDATLMDLDRTIQIAGGAINEARQIERDNRNQITQVNGETLATLEHLDDLIVSLDATQKQAGASIAQTSAAIAPIMEQSRKDLADLEPAIQQMTPLLMRTTDVAVNVSNATADVAHEIHKLVYPPPRKWYQKYILDPLNEARKMLTYTINR